MNTRPPASARRVRVKICGITTAAEAQAAAALGADAIGLNFYPPSSRFVSLEVARRVAAALPPFVNRVALFVNESRERVAQVLDAVPVDTLQFHGDEPAGFCRSFGLPYLKSVGVKADIDVSGIIERYPDAAGILLDNHDRVRWGGTGETFDWALVPGERRCPLILAGGLTADNVARAVAMVQPDAVDVSGGVEYPDGGKDPARIEAFMRQLRDS